jgi:hypothetical protein
MSGAMISLKRGRQLTKWLKEKAYEVNHSNTERSLTYAVSSEKRRSDKKDHTR